MSKENGNGPAVMPAETTELDEVADALVEQARADGVELTGPDGLLTGLIQRVLQGGLEAVSGRSVTRPHQ